MAYFTEGFIEFFRRLSRQNTRAWYHAHKGDYEQFVKRPFEEFVGEMIHRLAADDPSIVIEPKEAIFRLARDIRFSKDKTPYKTFVAAAIGPGGRKGMQLPGLYLQFGAAGVTIAGGLYQPDRASLLKIRRAIVHDGERLARALRGKRFKELFGELRGARNKRLPPEFARVVDKHPFVANKQFYYYAAYNDPTMLLRSDLADFVMRHHRTGAKVNAFLKAAVR